MADNQFLVKTAAGIDEVRSRARKLPQRVRTLLIMVDGQHTAQQLQQAARTLGAPEDSIAFLLQEGLIAPSGGSAPAGVSTAAVVPSASSASPSVTAPATAATPPSAAALMASAAPSAASASTVSAGGEPSPDSADDAQRFRTALKFMNEGVTGSLGLRAFFFTLKLEKCYTPADLLALVPEFARLVAKGSGEEVARVLEARVREMLNR